MARTGQYGGSERWQGTVIIENGDWYGKCRLPVVFSMERTGAPLPTAGSGVPGVKDCSNSIANALELLQSCTKPSNLEHMQALQQRQSIINLLSCVNTHWVSPLFNK